MGSPELVNRLYSGKGRDVLGTIELARLLCEDNERRKKITDLAEYIGNSFFMNSDFTLRVTDFFR
jgi:C4-type Zn-finger protein